VCGGVDGIKCSFEEERKREEKRGRNEMSVGSQFEEEK
jgi:hypothetical protein